MCKEGREHKSHYVPGMNLSPGDSTGAKERACSHGVARLASQSRCSRLDVGLKPPTTWLHHFLSRKFQNEPQATRSVRTGQHVLKKRENHWFWREKSEWKKHLKRTQGDTISWSKTTFLVLSEVLLHSSSVSWFQEILLCIHTKLPTFVS